MNRDPQPANSICIADENGNTARVLVRHGFNCCSLRLAASRSDCDILWSPKGLGDDPELSALGGIPLLFPFAGRLRGPSLQWQGHAYPFSRNDGQGNGIHGLVSDRPWRLLHSDGASVTAAFQLSVDAPELAACWPADFHIEARYSLRQACLRGDFVVSNPDRLPLPFGFGLHPYFRLPKAQNRAIPCVLHLPFRQRWILRDLLPLGSVEAIDRRFWSGEGFPLGEHEFDAVLTTGSSDGHPWTAQLHDLASGVRTTLTASEAFTECVLYTPPHREAVSIEPLTRVPNAPELHSHGIGSGLQVLEPGESQRLWIEVSAQAR